MLVSRIFGMVVLSSWLAGGCGGDSQKSLVCGPSGSPASLPMDGSGWVPASSNPYCIQGEWKWTTDAVLSGGQGVYTGLVANAPPYVEGSGMCIKGSSPGGEADNYQTWGANVYLLLNQSAPGAVGAPLKPGPQCFTITVAGSSPGGISGMLCPQTRGGMGIVCPQKDLVVGPNEVCVDNVTLPSFCSTTTRPNTTCYDPSQLSNGIVGTTVQGSAGATGGVIDFCVTSIVPHDHL